MSELVADARSAQEDIDLLKRLEVTRMQKDEGPRKRPPLLTKVGKASAKLIAGKRTATRNDDPKMTAAQNEKWENHSQQK